MRKSHQKWQRLHQSQARNVWPTAIRIIGKQTPQKTIEQTRLPTKQIVTRSLETYTRPIQFTLVVDNFGVKYEGKEHPQHSKNTLEEHYKLTCDWTGT